MEELQDAIHKHLGGEAGHRSACIPKQTLDHIDPCITEPYREASDAAVLIHCHQTDVRLP
jgi:hypothetical protein